jgi:hypothetical protein
MIMMNRLSIQLLGIALLLPLIGMVGCETESSDQIAVTITPNAATLSKGGTQTFTAAGWQDYTWSLSDISLGTLSTKKGSSTTYTAAVTNAVQVLTLSVNNSTTRATNVIQTVTAEAIITHI